MNNRQDCIFCNFEAKYIITETSLSLATYFPRAIKKGHFVVAVKDHLPTFTDLNEEQVKDLSALALKLAKVAQKIVGAEKYYLVAIGDLDRHFHVHLLPKLVTDEPMGKHIMLESGWKGEVGQNVSEDEVHQFILSLRESCV